MGISRRTALTGGVGAFAGAGLVGGAQAARAAYDHDRPLPFYGGYASLLQPDPTEPVAASARLVWSADTTAKALALTFDDGPAPDWTPRVLAALADADVPATFFCRGDHVVAHGELHRDPHGRHELGNHTWDHADLGRLDFDRARAQLQRCSDAMQRAYGRRPTLFRPPYGHVGGAALAAAASLGLTTVAWSAQFREAQFRDHPERLIDDAVSLVRPGSIVLAHDTGPKERLETIDRLPQFLDRLTSDGWSFHTVSGLLALPR